MYSFHDNSRTSKSIDSKKCDFITVRFKMKLSMNVVHFDRLKLFNFSQNVRKISETFISRIYRVWQV